MQTKKCTICEKNLPNTREFFNFKKLRKDGSEILRAHCKKCACEYSKNFRKANLEQEKIRNKEYREKTRDSEIHILKRLIVMSKKRAKKKAIDHKLTTEDLGKIPKNCPVLGIELKCNKGKTASKNSPTLDRKDNNRGYTKDNVEVISFEANSIKGDATSDKLFQVALYAEKCEGKGNRFTRWLKSLVFKYL